MNYYLITKASYDECPEEFVLTHSAYYSKQEFSALVKEALTFIHGKMEKANVANKKAWQLSMEVIGYLIATYGFEYLDTDEIEARYYFMQDYTKEELHEMLGNPRMYTSELLEELNKEIEDDYKRKID